MPLAPRMPSLPSLPLGAVLARSVPLPLFGACPAAPTAGVLCLQVPVFVFAPEEEGQFQPGRCSRWWLHNSLQALEKDLAALGSRLTFRRSPESRLALVQVGPLQHSMPSLAWRAPLALWHSMVGRVVMPPVAV